MGTTVIAVITLVAINAVSMVAFFLIMKSRFSRDRILGELRAEVDRLVMDLGREADRDVAILESRIQNLRSLMDEADRRILVAGKETARRKEETDILQNIALQGSRDAMEKTAQGAQNAQGSQGSQGARQPVRQSTPEPVARVTPKYETQFVPQAEPKPAPGPATHATPQAAPKVAATDTPKGAESEPVLIYTRPVITRSERQIEPFVPVQDRVLDMAKRGFTAELIAGTLSMPLGEVELILDMNRSSL